MKQAQIAVNIRVPLSEDSQANDPTFIRDAMEYMRRQAEGLAATKGGRVVTDRMPTFIKPQIAAHATFGGNWFLWASMWWVEVPDSADIESIAIG
jgi:hypothetical protein